MRLFAVNVTVKPRDIVLFMSDAAWTPLSRYLLEKTVCRAILEHFSDVPTAVFQAASRTGRWDDTTVVARG